MGRYGFLAADTGDGDGGDDLGSGDDGGEDDDVRHPSACATHQPEGGHAEGRVVVGGRAARGTRGEVKRQEKTVGSAA